MSGKKLLMPLIMGSALCLAAPGMAQNGMPPGGGPGAPKCPALQDASKCPALQGAPAAGAQAGQKSGIDKKIDKKMSRIVRALERNKRSADALIQAAKDAGADPNAIADMEKLSAGFRQVFMSTVSPQQIVESIFAAPAPPEQPAAQGIIITGPDGSTWLVAPDQQNPQTWQQPGKPVPPQRLRGQRPPLPGHGMQPQQGMMAPPPPGMQPQQGMIAPQTPPMPPKGFRAPQKQPGNAAPQGELIIMEETVTPGYMPLWPTKEELGKDGVLKYLEKRNSVMNAN